MRGSHALHQAAAHTELTQPGPEGSPRHSRQKTDSTTGSKPPHFFCDTKEYLTAPESEDKKFEKNGERFFGSEVLMPERTTVRRAQPAPSEAFAQQNAVR